MPFEGKKEISSAQMIVILLSVKYFVFQSHQNNFRMKFSYFKSGHFFRNSLSTDNECLLVTFSVVEK